MIFQALYEKKRNKLALTKEDILKAFEEIGKTASEQGIIIGIGVYGGAAIALQREFRRSTRVWMRIWRRD